MRTHRIMALIAVAFTLPWLAAAQSTSALAVSPDNDVVAPPDATITAPPVLAVTPNSQVYSPPSRAVRFHNFTFDLLGPYPLFTSAAAAGIHQATRNPPEWGEGSAAYFHRFGSSYGISAVETSARYGLAELLNEDTLYYPCACSGFWPRFGHAVLSSFTGRRGLDGHRVLSAPSILSPFAGTFTATYVWYPRRYEAQDAARMGMNGLLSYVGGNISLEFLYGGPHSLLSKAHLPALRSMPPPDQDHQ